MTTTLFFHAANSQVKGTLPTTTQSGLTIQSSVDAQTVNRLMNTTIGTSQTTLVLTSAASVSTLSYYFSRFVSPPLISAGATGTTTIAADTWTFAFGGTESNASANWPTTTSGTGPVSCYVWRPSTGTKVGNILISATGMGTISEAGTTETALSGTFSGSAVTFQVGDVICFEVVFTVTQASATAFTDTFSYDGTTQSSTSSNAASLAATQNIQFSSILPQSEPEFQPIDPGIIVPPYLPETEQAAPQFVPFNVTVWFEES